MKKLRHEFVEFIPKELEDNVIYISIRFKTVVHKCACGCGNKTVTRLSPTDWKFTFDGDSVTLYPSIGNWGFPCQSHYWITNNKIEWAESWSNKWISSNRETAKKEKRKYFKKKKRWNFLKSILS
ncbi:MAG: DUF6527 family protein [Bacteroidales bacterium]|jgi:hypothetical protein|nr:DUF6527 family protein [Bacteroidales bacterium]